MKEDSKAYLRFLQGFGIGACGAMLHQYVAFAAVIIALVSHYPPVFNPILKLIFHMEIKWSPCQLVGT